MKRRLSRTRRGGGCVRYNSAGLQRDRIKAYLIGRGTEGALAVEIQAECGAPCVTKRISELRRAGEAITTSVEFVTGEHGRNEATRYFLLEVDPRQGLLDLQPQDLTPTHAGR